VRIDQNRVDAGAAQHRRRQRTGKTAANDGNISAPLAPRASVNVRTDSGYGLAAATWDSAETQPRAIRVN